MKILIKWLILAISILISSHFITEITVDNFWTAIWLALFLAFINVTLKPLLIILTLPINIFTLGSFTFVINALLVLLASSVIDGFTVGGFWTAMLFSIVLSIINYFLNKVFIK